MEKNIKELQYFAKQIRVETLKEFQELGFGHVGGAMSIVDTLAVLYGGMMRINPSNPKWEGRDYLVVSKGHAGPAVYAALALKGFFSMELLKTLNKAGTDLPSHCDRNHTIGIDMTTGSLGQGMSTALGLALGNRIDQRDSYVYLIIGDGECDEGQIWEGALSAANYKTDNFIMFVDANKQQLDGYTDDVLALGDIAAKFEAFGWYTQSIDGHNVSSIWDAVETAKIDRKKPSAIILNTKKGYGCSIAEGETANHHMTFTKEKMQKAIDIAQKALDAAAIVREA
jgi:transketolase